MHENSQYNQMVIYVESCESGSMFNKLLPTDINGKTLLCSCSCMVEVYRRGLYSVCMWHTFAFVGELVM